MRIIFSNNNIYRNHENAFICIKNYIETYILKTDFLLQKSPSHFCIAINNANESKNELLLDHLSSLPATSIVTSASTAQPVEIKPKRH
jgi:hypothetical protein